MVKYAPCRADFVGVNRDKVAFAEGKTDISGWKIINVVKYPG